MIKYVLSENGKVLHRSGDFAKLLNFTTKTENAVISIDGVVVWVQRPEHYIK